MDETYLDYNGLQRYHELIQKQLPTEMSASGTNHKGGLVPDPGATAGTSKFLREDGTWQLPPNTTYESKAAASEGTALSLVTTGEKYTWNSKLDYDAKLFTTNNFAAAQDAKLYISKIDNGLYLADKRFTTSMSINGASSFTPVQLFDGNYETRYNIPDGQSSVITIDFSAQSSSKFPGYPYGELCVCFYGGRDPKTITGRIYNNYASQGVGWKTITFVQYHTANIYSAALSWYGLQTIEITIEAKDSSTYSETGPCQIEFRMTRPGNNLTPMVSKYFAETLYYPLTAPSFIGDLTGKVNNYTINSNVPSNAVFTDTTYKFTIGSTTNGDTTNGVSLGTLKSETATASGTTLSLVTTGEKATWNAKQDALTFNTTPSSSNKVATMADVPSIPSGAVFTDVSVTSVNNHYTPSANANSELTASISGTAGTYALNTEYTVLTGVKAQRDAKGHITGLTYTAQKVKDTNTQAVSSVAGKTGAVTLNYSDIGYTVYAPSATSGSITINYNNGPIQVITLSGDVSSVNVSNVPAGHSCHVIFVSNSASYTRSIAIAHNSSTRCCPEGQDLSLTVPEQGNGYTEVDFLNANNIIYVRGV